MPCFLHQPCGQELPIVLDSPHSGRSYPEDFRFSAPRSWVRLAEDTYVEELYSGAPEIGATLIEARFPRSYIDPNRDLQDLDEALLAEPWPLSLQRGPKTALGVGLVWKLVRDSAGNAIPLYDRMLSVAEVQRRIALCYVPYHAAVQEALDRAHSRFGAAWHINCHSMQSVGDALSSDPGRERADFVLGDRDATTCAPAFTAFVSATLAAKGYRVAINDPFKGVELVKKHGRPTEGRHSLQIEINRKLYMDEKTLEKHAGFDRLHRDLNEFLHQLAAFVRTQSR